jgi:predicted HAD superfamily Cof-like phosphohydrolase
MSVNALNELERVDAEGLVHTSVEDSREYLRALNPDNNEYGQAGLERNLRVLRAALELEKEGQARTTLIGAMRVLIRANEGALERNDDLVVADPAAAE